MARHLKAVYVRVDTEPDEGEDGELEQAESRRCALAVREDIGCADPQIVWLRRHNSLELIPGDWLVTYFPYCP